MDNHFKINIKNGIANPKSIYKGKNYRITILSDVLIRFEYNEKGIFNDYPTLFAMNRNFPTANVQVKEDEKFLIISNSYFTLEYTKEKPFIASKFMPDVNLRVTLTDTDKIWYFNHMEVRNFLGSAYSLDEYKGKVNLKKGIYSPEGFASFDDSNNLVFIDKGTIHKNPSNGKDVYLFIYKQDFGLALKSYFDLTGYPLLVPRYSLGIWWSKNELYNERDIEILKRDFYRNEIPLSVLLLDKKWHIQKDKQDSGFTFNTKLFPNPIEFTNNLHKSNIFLGVNINTKDGIDVHEATYQNVAKVLGDNSNKIIPINVFNENMINVFCKYILDYLESLGVDFFWLDDNSKDDIVKSFILNHYIYRNYNKTPNKRGIILSRNYGIASHRYSILYSGNTFVSWKTLKFLPYYNSTASNIGLSWWSHDIGGFKGGIEDEELFLRYVQLGVYSPIFRFASEAGKYYKREPWKWDYKTLKITKDYIRLRHSLIPYLYTEAYKYHKYGLPLIQPLYYKYPKTYDEPLYKNEYFFGTEFFVSPITTSKDLIMNRVVHRIFLPNGDWYDFKTGKKFPGGNRYVTFFKDEDYPVFAKSGAIIPMAIINDNNLNDSKSPKSLEIQVFPGRNNQYTLYEDDGISNHYKQGYYIITNIKFDYKEDDYNLSILPIEGKSGVIPEQRNYKIKFRNTKYTENVKVTVNNMETKCKFYNHNNDFIIEIENVPTTEELNVSCKGEKLEIEAFRLINEDLDEIINDLKIETTLKEKIANVIFSDLDIKKKRIEIKRLRRNGLKTIFIKMFMKLLEYIAEI